MSVSRNFLGIPISGEISAGNPTVEQYPREQFEPLVKALLDDPFVVEFGWHQYTPYFNDGDPCVFGAGELWVRTQDDTDDEDEDYYDRHESLTLGYKHPTLGGTVGYAWRGEEVKYVGNHEELWSKAKKLDSAIQGGHFDNVLLELFGDHAEIIVRRTGISVDEYSHD